MFWQSIKKSYKKLQKVTKFTKFTKIEIQLKNNNNN